MKEETGKSPKEVKQEMNEDRDKGKNYDGDKDNDKKEENILSEEFQNRVHGIVSDAKHSHMHLNHIRDRVSDAHDELRRKEDEERSKKSNKTPNKFSTAEMPSSY